MATQARTPAARCISTPEGIGALYSPERSAAMKKAHIRQRKLVLQKEAIQILSTYHLEAVGGGVESNTLTLCLTRKTCASVEFSC
jgi:hypothetical protein